MNRLRCSHSGNPFGPVDFDVDWHLQPIYDLLANGVNTQVILVKDSGEQVTYELAPT